jgi:hypothetical protein
LAHQVPEPWEPAELVDLLVGAVEAAVAQAAGDEAHGHEERA